MYGSEKLATMIILASRPTIGTSERGHIGRSQFTNTVDLGI